MDELNRMHDEATTALYGIEKQISTAETLDKNAQSNRSLIGKERKQTETARQAVADIEGIIKECEARITSSNKLIKLKTEEINIASKKVEKWLADSLWQNDWKKDMPEFAHELNSATKVYGNNKNRQLNLEQEIREQKISTDNVTENLKAIIALMPEWEAIKISNIHEIRNLQRETNDLRAKVNSTIEQMKKTYRLQMKRCNILMNITKGMKVYYLPDYPNWNLTLSIILPPSAKRLQTNIIYNSKRRPSLNN